MLLIQVEKVGLACMTEYELIKNYDPLKDFVFHEGLAR